MTDPAGAVLPSQQSGTKKRDEKIRRRDPRSWENVLRASSTHEKPMEVIAEKYNELYVECRKATIVKETIERQCNLLLKEKDQIQSEHSKAVLAKARLENLCRELQKQNKQIKEENVAKLKEEEERRREVSQRFTEKLNDISKMMEETNLKSNTLHNENVEMQLKFRQLNDLFKDRGNSLSKMAQEVDLQKKLSKATVEKLEFEIKAEREIWEKERERLLKNLERSENNCQILQENIISLQDHLTIYKNQYSDIETTMSKSNKVFTHFKEDFTKMNKQIKALEKEVTEWKSKYHASSNALINATEEQMKFNTIIRASESKISCLQNLCRQLQLERTAYIKQLKDLNVEPETIIPVAQPEQPSTPTAPSQTLSSKEKKLQELKCQLKDYQELLAKTKQEELTVDQTKTESKKSKKNKKKQSKQEPAKSVKTEEQNGEIEMITKVDEPEIDPETVIEADDSSLPYVKFQEISIQTDPAGVVSD